MHVHTHAHVQITLISLSPGRPKSIAMIKSGPDDEGMSWRESGNESSMGITIIKNQTSRPSNERVGNDPIRMFKMLTGRQLNTEHRTALATDPVLHARQTSHIQGDTQQNPRTQSHGH